MNLLGNFPPKTCLLSGPPNGEDLRPLRNGAGHLEQRPGRLRLTCHGTAGDHQTREARGMGYLWDTFGIPLVDVGGD